MTEACGGEEWSPLATGTFMHPSSLIRHARHGDGGISANTTKRVDKRACGPDHLSATMTALPASTTHPYFRLIPP
jgi:hypothetical protein